VEDGDSGLEDEDDATAVEEEDLTPHGDMDDGCKAHDEAAHHSVECTRC